MILICFKYILIQFNQLFKQILIEIFHIKKLQVWLTKKKLKNNQKKKVILGIHKSFKRPSPAAVMAAARAKARSTKDEEQPGGSNEKNRKVSGSKSNDQNAKDIQVV